jgi:hypothetical protein
MKYYRYLDLDFLHVAEKLETYAINNKDKIKGFWIPLDTPKILYLFPEIQKMFDPLNIKIKRIILVHATMPLGEIHRDISDCNVRINIPILNCIGSITNFYKSDTEPVLKRLRNGTPYYYKESNECTLVDSFCLDRPAAIRVTALHQVIVNNACVPRISCTIEFEENIDYLLE